MIGHCRLFRFANANILALYRSTLINTNALNAGTFPKNTWVDLPITNQYNPATLAMTNTTTAATHLFFALVILVPFPPTWAGRPRGYVSSGMMTMVDLPSRRAMRTVIHVPERGYCDSGPSGTAISTSQRSTII